MMMVTNQNYTLGSAKDPTSGCYRNKKAWLFSSFFLFFAFLANAQITRYVRESASSTGSGSSWTNASSDLQAMINSVALNGGGVVRVAAGTYKPTTNLSDAVVSNSRQRTFHVKDGVTILGGFDSATGLRNSETNQTILSGDFSDNDIVTGTGNTLSITGNEENAYHVVTCRGYSNGKGVTIDGCHIKGGNANSATTTTAVNPLFPLAGSNYGFTVDNTNGGGIFMLLATTNVNITNNRIFHNTATNGSGVYVFQGIYNFSGNSVHNNKAAGNGAGIYLYQGVNIIYNNSIHKNISANNGAGMYNYQGTNVIENNNIYSNIAVKGGGINIFQGTNSIKNNSLYLNSADEGAGIYNLDGTNLFEKNRLYDNTANKGGGFYVFDGTNTLTNNVLIGNKATSDGGGIATSLGTNTIQYNIIYANTANAGGGLYLLYGTNKLINNTIYKNSASYGGGLSTVTDGNTTTNTLINNIFWDNKVGATPSANIEGADYKSSGSKGSNAFRNNLLQLLSNKYGDYNSLGTNSSGNIFNQNPVFVNIANIAGADGNYGTADDGLQLAGCSVAIDAGLTSFGTPNIIPTNDIANTLVYNSIKDMGAFERQSAKSTLPTIYNVGGGGNYCTASSNIAVSLSGSQTGVTYQLKNENGTNIGTPVNGTGASISFGNRPVGTYLVWATKTDNGCVSLMNGSVTITNKFCCTTATTLYVNASIVGGLGNGTSWVDAYSELGDALKAAHSCNVVKNIKVAAGTYKPIYKSFSGATESVTTDNRDKTFHIPNNVTIEGGYDATGARDITANITILSGDIGLADVTIDNAYHVVYVYNSSSGGSTINGFHITRGNAGQSFGGGAIINGGINTFINNTVYNNFAAKGGGVSIQEGGHIVDNNIIYDNTADVGGGIYAANGSHKLNNNILYYNTAGSGGAIGTYFSFMELINNVIYSNSAERGGGVYLEYGSSTNQVINNTLFNNSGPYGGGGIFARYCTNNIINNIFWENTPTLVVALGTADFGNGPGTTNTFKNNFLQFYTTLNPANTNNIIKLQGNYNSMFIDPTNPEGPDGKFRTADDGLRLSSCAPVFNKGLNSFGTVNIIPAKDINNNAIVSGTKDMGAYEHLGSFFTPTIYNVTGGGTFCAGDVVSASIGLSSSQTGVSYQLKRDDINLGNPLNGNGAALNFGNFSVVGTYTIEATTPIGACATMMSGNAKIIINPLPVIVLTTSDYCGGSQIIANYNGPNSYKYLWSNGVSSGFYTNVHSINITNSGTYSVTATSGDNCKSTASAVVNPKVLPTATISSTDNCGSSFINLTTNATGYKWSNGATTEDITVSQAGTYSITVTGANGCTANINRTPAFKKIPDVDLQVTNSCGQSESSLIAYSSDASSYLWSNGSTSSAILVIPVTTPTTYTITCTATNGCTVIKSGVAIKREAAMANISVNACENTAILEASGTNITAYKWFDNTTTSSTSVTLTATPVYYELTVTNTDNCTATQFVRLNQSSVLYVNTSALGRDDGSSWGDAYTNLSDALAKAHSCNYIKNIKVAKGTYKPTKKPFNAGVEMVTSDNRDKTFHVPDGVTIEGGYQGSSELRNINSYITILSGDFDGNDQISPSFPHVITNNTENAYHVVLSSANSTNGLGIRIDGFDIRGGNANGSGIIVVNGNDIYRNDGGGIENYHGASIISNNKINYNSSNDYGGGVFNFFGTTTLTNNEVEANKSNNGAIATYYGNTIVKNNKISVNVTNNGGGVYAEGSTTLLTNNQIYSNGAGRGGGFFANGGTNTIIDNSINFNKTSTVGAGIYTNAGTNTITKNSIYYNLATTDGGGIYTNAGTNTITKNSIYYNSATTDGGGIYTNTGTNTMINNILYTNSTNTNGGGIYTNTGNNTIINNTLYDNKAITNGGGIYTNSSNNTLSNNIFWGNKLGTVTTTAGSDYYAAGTNSNTFKNNLLQLANTNYPLTNTGTFAIGLAATDNKFNVNPSFVSPNSQVSILGLDYQERTSDDGLGLLQNSPAINAGTSNNSPTTDITDADRIGQPDMGAYEYSCVYSFKVTGGGAVCSNDDGGIPIGLSGSQTGVTYQLKRDLTNVVLLNGTGSSLNFGNFLTSGTYTVVASKSNACSATMIGSATITITPMPTITINVANNCGNSTLTATGTGISYAWSNGEKVPISTVTTAGTYKVTATGAGNCIAVESAIAAPKTYPSSNLSVYNNCGNTKLIPTSGLSNYLWSNGATTPDITVSNSGNYSVTLTGTNGCSAIANGIAAPNELPTSYNVTGGGSYCAGLEALAIGLSGSQVGVLYQLKRNNANLLAQKAGTGSAFDFAKLSTGIYTVVALSSLGCTSTMTGSATVSIIPTVFVAASVPANVTVNCDNIPAEIMPTTSSCATVSLTTTSTKGINVNQCNFYSYTITRVWTATDKIGSTATASQVITVTNKIAPIIGALSNVTVTEFFIPTTVPLTLNSCNAAVTVSFIDTKTTLTPLACQNYHYILNRTWTATDACGNSNTATQKITARGIKLTCPSDKTLNTTTDGVNNYNCSTIVAASHGLAPVFLDNCNLSNMTYSVTGATVLSGSGTVAGLDFYNGISTVAYKLVTNGITDQCTFKINIEDKENPKITTTTTIYDDCTFPDLSSIPIIPTVTSDNCSGTVYVINALMDVSIDLALTCKSKVAAQKYTKQIVRTWYGIDQSNNTGTNTQNFYLRDNIPPIAICKDITVFIGAANVTVPAVDLNNSSLDNCSSNVLTYSICRPISPATSCTNFASSLSLTPSMIPTGATSVMLPVVIRVTDPCGNTTTCTANIILKRAGTTLANSGNTNTNLSIISDSANETSATPAVASGIDATHGSLQCFPNPFSDDLNLRFNLVEDVAKVVLKIYDSQGKLVAQNEQPTGYAGYYTARWNLSDLPAGMYHICLEIDGKCTKVERVIMMK
jgi:hypothetical protein